MTRGRRTTTDTTGTTAAGDLRRNQRVQTFLPLVVLVVCVVVAPSALLAQGGERIAEIRVHGNHSTPDADVLSLSGLEVGAPATDKALRDAEKAIRRSHRFSGVEVRRRYLSISDPTRILVMVVVNEKSGVSEQDLTPGFGRQLRASAMFLPILNYADGYGFTYGLRTTFPRALDENTRLSVPLSWGGERRAGVEVDHWFGGSRGFYGVGRRDPVVRLISGLAVYRRENPHYTVPDLRQEARLRAEHPINSWLRAGGTVKTARVAFGSNTPPAAVRSGDPVTGAPALLVPARTVDRHDAFSADLVVDTRLDPSFPRNAVYASLGREALRWEDGGRANRWLTDLRAYAGVGGSMVVALRTQLVTSDRALPASEQPLLGGTDTLRGYRAGAAAGDNLATVSTELRVPLTNPLDVGRFGVKGFVDWGTTWANGARLADATWERGIGGGIFFGGGPVILDVAAAWAQDGSARVNVGLGVSF